MCYAGQRENATAYFRNIGYACPNDTNPAEFFIDLVTIDTVSELVGESFTCESPSNYHIWIYKG